MNEWYQELLKPIWAPPAWLFGPVWTVLYIIIGITFGYALILFIKRKIPFTVLLPFILNLVFNLLFTPIQFILENNILAAIDIVLVLVTLIWFMKAIFSYTKWIAYSNIPYLIWISFATILQFTITFMNL